eukprot:GSChrysophyteH1.ASY1.ANO1.3142.1 assembled CDS
MPFYCYLLKSVSSPSCSATYIGFTVNPRRRLRQHNGELKSGATKTHKYRPWEHVCIVSGFPSKVVALMFEWQWQHPRGSRILKDKTPFKYSGKGVRGQLHILNVLLNAPLWDQLNLRVSIWLLLLLQLLLLQLLLQLISNHSLFSLPPFISILEINRYISLITHIGSTIVPLVTMMILPLAFVIHSHNYTLKQKQKHPMYPKGMKRQC